LAAVVAILGIGLPLLVGQPPGLREGASLTLAGVAIALFACGFLGAVGELLFGRTVVGRAFFGGLAALAVIGGPWRFVTIPILLSAGAVAMGGVIFLGSAMVILRWREAKTGARLCRLVLVDAENGDAFEFRAVDSDAGASAGDDHDGTFEPIKAADVLPASHLVVRADGERPRTWQVMPIVLVAVAPELSRPHDLEATDSSLQHRRLTPRE